MASKQATEATNRPRSARLIAPVMPDSWDPDAAEDANDPELMAALADAAEKAKDPANLVSAEDVAREFAFTDEELAAGRAAVDRQVAEAEAGRAPRDPRDRGSTEEPPRRRASGPRPTVPNGKILLRVPLSVHRELMDRAEAEQTSLNQLVLAYVSRGLGQDAGAPVR